MELIVMFRIAENKEPVEMFLAIVQIPNGKSETIAILKDIYKIFSKSPKKENILHEIQAVINDPVLKIPNVLW